ncbi:type II secretion system protein GspM [Teredinibacter purpureus]|uniref:type II secretion system protein GspM n=1 Tax=Teredinibacter purpureus TaxID=2731756 RepID=UPI0005F79796|nr:type II secretion system protein M [Teredinibacter purpureus]
MDDIKEWWNQASTRDQIALVVCGGILAVYLAYVVLLKPVTAMRDEQIRKNASQEQALERVRNYAAIWVNQGTKKKSASNKGSIVEVVDSSLRQNNLKLSGMQPSGSDDVRIRLEQVAFDNLLAWLYQIEVTQRIQVKDISVATGSSTGLVSANLRLHRD